MFIPYCEQHLFTVSPQVYAFGPPQLPSGAGALLTKGCKFSRSRNPLLPAILGPPGWARTSAVVTRSAASEYLAYIVVENAMRN